MSSALVMRKPYCIIKSVMKIAPAGSLSKHFIPVSPKDPKVAARFCAPDGSLSKLQLIAMAKSDKHSVNYETILGSDAMEKNFMHTIISGSGKHMPLPLVMASYMALLDLMIACRCLDMPPSAIRTQAESVWLMRYAIKHAHTAFLKMSIKEQYLNHFLVRAKEVDRLLLFDLAL